MTTAPQTPAHPTDPGRKRSWIALGLAGTFEVGYALSVAGSRGFTALGWSLSAAVFFLLTLYFLSLGLKRIDVGIGYAVWAGIGAAGATLLGPVLFDQPLTPVGAVSLVVVIAGVVWLKLADSPRLSAGRSTPPHDTNAR